MAKFKKYGSRKRWSAPPVHKQRHLACWDEIDSTGKQVQVFNYVRTPEGGCRHQSSMNNGETASCMYCFQDIIKCCGDECNHVATVRYASKNWKSGYCKSCEDDYDI